jgi:hypothetical protein
MYVSAWLLQGARIVQHLASCGVVVVVVVVV